MKTAKIGVKVRISGNARDGRMVHGLKGEVVIALSDGWVVVRLDDSIGRVDVHLGQLREIKKVPKQCPKCKDLKTQTSKTVIKYPVIFSVGGGKEIHLSTRLVDTEQEGREIWRSQFIALGPAVSFERLE